MYLLCSIRLEYLLNFTGKLLNGWHAPMQAIFLVDCYQLEHCGLTVCSCTVETSVSFLSIVHLLEIEYLYIVHKNNFK